MYLLQKLFQANNNPRIHLITSMLFVTRKDALKEMHKQVKIALGAPGPFDEDHQIEDSEDQIRISNLHFSNTWIISEIEDKPVRAQSDDLIPIGCEYTFAETEETIVGNGVDVYFPATMELGDYYDDEFYRYIISEDCGLAARAREKDLTDYGPLLESICGEPLRSLSAAFYGCQKMRVAPKIPESVTNMSCTFCNCEQLATAPKIPSGVGDLDYAFFGCRSLSVPPVVPESVTSMIRAFDGCTNLTGTLICNANPTECRNALMYTKITAIEGDCTEVTKVALLAELRFQRSQEAFLRAHS